MRGPPDDYGAEGRWEDMMSQDVVTVGVVNFAPVPNDPHPDMTPLPSGTITSGLPIT